MTQAFHHFQVVFDRKTGWISSSKDVLFTLSWLSFYHFCGQLLTATQCFPTVPPYFFSALLIVTVILRGFGQIK